MVFFILKNWRKSETHFLIEPNRFELFPKASRLVKIFLNAESPVQLEEEFTVEGCSVNFPVRELIVESKLLASIIRPVLNFSQDEVKFDCFYNATREELLSKKKYFQLNSPTSKAIISRNDSNHQQVEPSAANCAKS